MQPFRIYNCQLCGWINLPPPADINSPREPATSRGNSLCNIGVHTELRLLALPILVRGMFKKHGQFASFGGFRGNSDQYLLETTAAVSIRYQSSGFSFYEPSVPPKSPAVRTTVHGGKGRHCCWPRPSKRAGSEQNMGCQGLS